MLELDASLSSGAAPGAMPAAFDGALWWHGAPLHRWARPAHPPITGGRDA